MKRFLFKFTIKAIVIALRHLYTLSALSFTVLLREKIGMDVFLPWNIKPKNPFLSILLRLWTALLVFVWIRFFFIIEVLYCPNPAPFVQRTNLWKLFTDHGIYDTMSVAVFLHYLSFWAVFCAFDQIISSEIYYRRREAISPWSLGESKLSTWLEGKKIFFFTIDRYLIWGFIEPSLIVGVAFLVKTYLHSPVLSAFVLIAGVSMFFQGQYVRLQRRRDQEGLFRATFDGESIQSINRSFRQNQEKQLNGWSDDEVGEASIMERNVGQPD